MNSLPPVTDPSFREQLRAAREARGLSQYALAKLAGIAGVMPKRYEDASDRYATLPNNATWNKLNAVLFGSDQEQAAHQARAHGSVPDSQLNTLAEASIEEIVAELKRRGASSIVINW